MSPNQIREIIKTSREESYKVSDLSIYTIFY